MNQKNFSIKCYDLNIDEVIILDNNKQQLLWLLQDTTPMDYYCDDCDKSKTFMQNSLKSVATTSKYNGLESLNMFKLTMEEDKIKYSDSSYSSTTSNELYLFSNMNLYIFKEFKCPSCEKRIVMIFDYDGKSIKKIYQSYQNTLINEDEMKRFKKLKLLDENDILELSKANKCKTLGMSIASFVYLRRVFENMLDKIYNREKEKIKLEKTKVEFSSLPIKEKVSLLKAYLPTLLNEKSSNAKYGELYKILSEGIHNLDEKTCDSLFNFLIELILLILEKEQSMKKEEQYLKQLSQTYNTIFNTDNPKE